jgi:hypothetical protein
MPLASLVAPPTHHLLERKFSTQAGQVYYGSGLGKDPAIDDIGDELVGMSSACLTPCISARLKQAKLKNAALHVVRGQ